MIKQPEFSEEPRSLRETGLRLDRLAQTESVFALSNGHLGWRGNRTKASRTACRAPR
jgi:alpha,alpha-trehalose phosphorylase